MKTAHCEDCNKSMPAYDTVQYGSMDTGYRVICSHCFNARVAKQSGMVDFENLQLEPISLMDGNGETHEFHFRIHLLGMVLVLNAFELRGTEPCGYQFEVHGAPDCDVFALLGKLVEKMRRALATKHLTPDIDEPQISGDSVAGRIEWDDDEDGELPLLVIDGREISWHDFGRMLMAVEGFQFKLTIGELSDEL